MFDASPTLPSTGGADVHPSYGAHVNAVNQLTGPHPDRSMPDKSATKWTNKVLDMAKNGSFHPKDGAFTPGNPGFSQVGWDIGGKKHFGEAWVKVVL